MIAAHVAIGACLLVPLLTFAQTTTPSSTPVANGTGAFVPLTHLPQIDQLAQSQGFATFVNALYKICIGAGAVLAVIMIMVAGVQIMTSRGSVTSNEKAKNRIQNAVFGLILVLAPTIVFGIINPDILNLNLGTEFGSLKQDQGINQAAFNSPTATSTNNNSYLLAYYYTRTNTSTNYTCYGGTVNSFPTQQACEATKSTLPTAMGQSPEGTTMSGITYVKSCELGDASSVSLTPPANLPRCPN